jgi:hypothetical protein
MPVTPDAPGIIQATFKATDANTGRPIINVLHFQAATITPSVLATLGARLKTDWATFFAAACANTYTIGTIRLDSLDHGAPFFLEVAMNAAAGSPGAPASSTTCYLLKVQTGLRGRNHEGRIYLGPAQTADLQAGDTQPTSAFISAVNANMVTFLGHLVTDSTPLVIWHRALGTAHVASLVSVEPLCATQRRRLRK